MSTLGDETIIEAITGREVLDSRGNPTVEVTVALLGGASGTAIVPSGAPRRARGRGAARWRYPRYGGKGVLNAVGNVNGRYRPRSPAGARQSRSMSHDRVDGSDNKGNLGANAMLGVSLAGAAGGAARCSPLSYLGGHPTACCPCR